MTVSVDEFRFLDPGPMVDGELELVVPETRWVDGMLQAAAHPLTRQVSPKDAELTREQFLKFIREHPFGRFRPEAGKAGVPSYTFWMRLLPGRSRTPVPMGGGVTLRVGHGENLERYLGHVGYGVYPPARGRHLAERAVRLLFPLARRHGLCPLWITCNPDNLASRRTCERLGGEMVEIVRLPEDHPLYLRGELEKCRYRIEM